MIFGEEIPNYRHCSHEIILDYFNTFMVAFHLSLKGFCIFSDPSTTDGCGCQLLTQGASVQVSFVL